MKAPVEVRRWVAKMRRRFGKKNGVIGSCIWDAPEIERKIGNNKRLKTFNVGIEPPERSARMTG